jgi:hypothetical protein
MIMHYLDPTYASGSFHTLEGLLMMGFGLLLLWMECAVLNGLASPPPLTSQTPRPVAA